MSDEEYEDGFVEIEYTAWIFPKCFECDEEILPTTKGKDINYIIEFQCACKTRVKMTSEYAKIADFNVIVQTLFFNNRLTKAALEQIKGVLGLEEQGKIFKQDDYEKLKQELLFKEL